MVWGGFSGNDQRALTRKPNRVTAQVYINVLQEHLLPLAELHDDLVFQQDNAPAHTARATTTFLEEHNIQTLQCPAQSLDLNPIKNLWGHMKEELETREVHTMQELWDTVEGVWNAIPPATITALVESIPRWMQAVLDAHGGVTRY